MFATLNRPYCQQIKNKGIDCSLNFKMSINNISVWILIHFGELPLLQNAQDALDKSNLSFLIFGLQLVVTVSALLYYY